MNVFTVLGISVIIVFVMLIILSAIKVSSEADIRASQMFEDWKKRNGIE